jgi:hypothetical protein
MRALLIAIFGGLLMAGCATRQAAEQPARTHQIEPREFDEATVASALVFTPPIVANQPPLELARDVRQPAAFVAYDQVFTTFFYVRLDDRQYISDDGRSQRRVVSETFGISSR